VIARAIGVMIVQWRMLWRGELVFTLATHPAVSCLLWGYFACYDVGQVRLGVLDEARTPESRALAADFERSACFRVAAREAGLAGLDRDLRAGRLDGALLLRRSPGRRRGAPLEVALAADGTDPGTSGPTLAYGARVASPGAGAAASGVRIWYNPSLRSSDSLLVSSLVATLFWFLQIAALAVTLERDRGTAALLAASPVRPVELWLGVAATYTLLGLWCGLLSIGIGFVTLGLPFRGSPGLLLATMTLFTLIHVNLGCIIARFVRRAEQCVLVSLLALFVSMGFGGMFVPIDFLPEWARRVTPFLPLGHGVAVFRGLFLKGADWHALAGEFAALAGFAVATSGLAIAAIGRSLEPSD
jgi:ABC-2 type transport system permease protein